MATPSTQQGIKTTLERDDNGKPRFHGCSSIKEYEFMGKLGEGTFGEVSKARSKKTGAVVALKKIIMHNEKDGFPITALREIKLLKMLDHVNILKLDEMAVEKSKSEAKKKANMFMVTPYMDHDLSGLLENSDVHFTIPQIKCYMLQLLEGVRYLHENRILHRDMKAANLLINNKGILQIADFGLARPYDDEPPMPGHGGGEATRDYTALVVTRWYRPPELLLSLRKYTTAIDMWGVGCVFGEMFRGKPILAGKTDVDQAHLIFDLVGSPNDESMPGWSELPGCEGVREWPYRKGRLEQEFGDQGTLTVSLLKELLKLDWRRRINAIDALKHPYFHTDPLPARPGDLPQFEDSHELDRRLAKKQALPPAPKGGSVGMGEWTGQGPPPGGGTMPPNQRGGPPRLPPNYTNGGGPPRRPPPPSDAPYTNNRPPHGGAPPPPPPGQMDYHHPRQPAWQQRDPLPPTTNLPPKPPVTYNAPYRPDPRERERDRDRYDRRDRDRDRGPQHPRRIPDGASSGGGGGGAKVDTYIPSYSSANANDRPSYRSRDEHYDRSGAYDDRMYDDPPAAGRDGRDRAGGGRRGRSRSPDPRDRDRDRDRRR